MRTYLIFYPGQERPESRSSIKELRDLPEGTAIEVEINGDDSYPIPVVDGRPDFTHGKAKHRARRLIRRSL